MAKKKAQKFGIGVAALAIATAVGAGLSDTVKDATKSVAGKATTWAQDRFERIFPSELPQADKDAALSILVAQLQGDDGTQTRHVVVSLRHAFGRGGVGQSVQVLDARRQMDRGKSGDVARDHGVAESEGRRWLKESGATILVWGEVAAKDKVLRLFFTLNTGKLDRSPQESYALSERLELAKDFQDDLGLVIAAHVTAVAAPAYETGRFIGDLLDDLYPRLTAIRHQLTQGPMAGTKPACDVTVALAAIAQSIGEQRGLNTRLLEAIELLRSVGSERTCLNDPYLAFAVRINLGNALATLGARESGTARLDEAVEAYREVLKEWTRERKPLGWAMIQTNLGTALWTLGERESGTARLDEAVAAYREALKEFTRERVPLQWALIQSNLGGALQRLSERESGTARLDEAVAAYREALKERTRERAPLDWALTQNNLGTALRNLGARESSTARLNEAVTAFREALKEFPRERVPLQWATTQNNLGLALWTLGGREDIARLDEAVAAFREALKEQTRERAPIQWAMTQNNLGLVLENFGERESGTARLEEAVAAYRAALEVFESAGAGYYVGVTRGSLARAEALLAERRARPH